MGRPPRRQQEARQPETRQPETPQPETRQQETPQGEPGVIAPPRRVLVIDAANVVGSVPDGWWRDRPGAARRLHAALCRALAGGSGESGESGESGGLATYDAVELILEGQARAGVPGGTVVSEATATTAARLAPVTIVHAPGAGDDTIAARCLALAATGAEVTLASADRGLLARVTGAGVRALGPRTLRSRLVAK